MNKQTNQKSGNSQQTIAIERIAILFNEANENYKSRPDLANRYVSLARKISLKYKVKFNELQKMQFCKKCGHYLSSGYNSKIRASRGKLLIHCSDCGSKRAFVYKP